MTDYLSNPLLSQKLTVVIIFEQSESWLGNCSINLVITQYFKNMYGSKESEDESPRLDLATECHYNLGQNIEAL